jgi:hypothetical protein
MNIDLETLKYPLGKFTAPSVYPAHLIEEKISIIKALPQQLQEAVGQLNNTQLDSPYRPEGWTVRQVVHHLADSHLNAFIRFKLSLTEDNTPNINAYQENAWAVMADSIAYPVQDSLHIITGLHARWTSVLSQMSNDDFEKSYFHPVQNRAVKLKEALSMYAWHSLHHLAHITQLIKRKKW